MTVTIVFIVLFGLLAIGAPVGFAMLLSGVLGLAILDGWTLVLGLLDTVPLSQVKAYELVTIPMFLLMAEFVLVSGIVDDLFAAAVSWVGRVRGGLAMSTALAGSGFAAVCGTSTGAAATLASTTLPAMLRQGYDPKLASGVVAISGTLAVLIPPSVAIIVFGLLADLSIGKLLIAGIIPGFIVAFAIVATVWVLVWRDPSLAPPGERYSWRAKLVALRGVSPMLVLFAGVTGAIYSGFATPTEASAVGAFGALALAIYRRGFIWRELGRAALRGTYNSCMITMIMLGAHIFAYFITLTQTPQNLISYVGGLGLAPMMVVVFIVAGLILLGMVMDQLAILVLTVPIIIPLVVSLGYDPIWFGIIIVVTGEIGLVSPPVGLNCFVVSRCAERPIGEVFHGVWPHVLAHLLVIALLLAIPEIVLWLPSMM